MAYHEIAGTRRYEYRYEDAGDAMTGWQDAGIETPATLEDIKKSLSTATYWEVRVVVSVARDDGEYAGLLYLTERIEGGTDMREPIL